MVVFHSMGGLGNQMFQYAAARRLAHTLGVGVAADTSWHRRRIPNATPRAFELGRLSVRLRELQGTETLWARLISDRYLSRLPLPNRWTVRRERSSHFDPSILHSRSGTYLYGYWQCPKYFDDIRNLLLSEFRPLDSPSEADRKVLEATRGCESVFVHVRRGDYVSLPSAANTHGTCSAEYYGLALRLLSQRVRDPVLFVFSDDPAWTRKNLEFAAPTVYVDHNGPDAAHQDLRLMASCRHAVIANSSFSWWGAWLSEHEKKIVIAPRRWFVNAAPSGDLFPESWETI